MSKKGGSILIQSNHIYLILPTPTLQEQESLSAFEILTITFSFIVGLGVAQVLRSIAYVVREFRQIRLHWIPFSVAAQILFFQVQFWFALSVVNSLMDRWSWSVYASMLLLAIFIFLAGAAVLPHSLTSLGERGLKEDFDTRGQVSLIFLALYLAGWIGVGIMFWIPELWHLALVNGSYALLALGIFWSSNSRVRAVLHMLLIVITIYGSLTVWTTPSLEMPWRIPVETGQSMG
jgi:hypothetical protein